MDLGSKLEISSLFDAYGGLLTDKQREVLSLYLIDDLGITEIAQNLNKTRQAAYDFINTAISSLKRIEEKVGYAREKNNIKAELNAILSNSSLSVEQIKVRLDKLNKKI